MGKKTTAKHRAQTAQLQPGEDEEVRGASLEVLVRREFLRGGRILAEEIEDYKEDEIPCIAVRRFVGPHARIGLSMFQQWSMGGDNLVATTILMSIPCYREEADEAYEWADRWATQKMQVETKKIQSIQRKARGA